MNVVINLLMGPNMWSPCFSHSLQSFTQPNLINHLLCNPLIKGQLSYGMGLPRCLSGEEPACQSWDTSSAPGSGRSPGVRDGNLLQYSLLEKFQGQKTLAGYNPWRPKNQMWLSTHKHTHTQQTFPFSKADVYVFPLTFTLCLHIKSAK